MKIFWIVLGSVVLVLAAVATVRLLLARRKEKEIQATGTVVYAAVVAVEDSRGLAKQVHMKKFTLAIQEPGDTHPRNVELRSRTQPGQKIPVGQRLIVVIDPANPQRVYPAGEDAAKRVVMTGTRQERRAMNSQMRSPRMPQRRPGGYQPPRNSLR